MNIQNIPYKKLLKSWNITSNDFCYDLSYRNSFYFEWGESGCEIGFGVKTKSKAIVYVQVNHSDGNHILKYIGLKSRIGKKINNIDFTCKLNCGLNLVALNNYNIKITLDSECNLQEIYIEDESLILKNSPLEKNHKKWDILPQVEDQNLFESLVGEWKFQGPFISILNLYANNEFISADSEGRYPIQRGSFKISKIFKDNSFRIHFLSDDMHITYSKYQFRQDKLITHFTDELMTGTQTSSSDYRPEWEQIRKNLCL